MSKEVASNSELKKFCNRVRRAGGGKEIKDLLPAFPSASTECLIAKSLNFGCSVSSAWRSPESDPNAWSMKVDTFELAKKIGEKMGLEYHGREVFLPKKIYHVAQLYDATAELFGGDDIKSEMIENKSGTAFKYKLIESALTANERRNIKRFWPYIKKQIRKEWVKPSFI